MPVPEELKNYAAQLGFGESEIMGEILALLFPDQDSRRIAQVLSKPATFGEIAAATGIAVERVGEVADKLTRAGVIGRYLEPADKVKLDGAMI